MNFFKNSVLIFFISLIFYGCEDVINVKVPSSQPRLVIDASINWYKGTPGNIQKIRLTLTGDYFASEIPPANGAQVTITDANNNNFVFIEDKDTGIYINNTFIPQIGLAYTLRVVYNNEVYEASETLIPVSKINRVEQSNSGGFSGKEIELKAYYTDPIYEENFYFFEFINNKTEIGDLEVYNDEFTNGNEIFAYFTSEDIKTGDEIIIRSHGISEQFYEFMFLLLQQTDEDNGDPFETQPATLRGNCVNKTNAENFPLGYFRLSESDQFVYIIQ